MAYRVSVPGAPGGPIEFSFPVRLLIVPAWRTQQRPGLKARSPRLPIQHENGNPGAKAAQDATYLYNGAGGRTASWHMTVDHLEGFIDIPVDEVTYQAGDGAGPGNYNGLSCELSQWPWKYGSAAQWRQARRNAAEMMGRIGARVGAGPPAKQHANFMVKNCPQGLRSNAAWWSAYVDDYTTFYADEKRRMGGEVPVVATIEIGSTVKTTAALNLRKGPGTSEPVLRTLPAGTAGEITDGPAHRDGYRWWRIVDGDFNGVVAEDWLIVTAPPKKEAPVPTYARTMPVPELLETNLEYYDTAPGIRTVNEHDFVFVADVIEFTEPTPASQHAGKGAPAVKAPYKPGDRRIAAWLVETDTNGWWYVLAGGDDEWVRVPLRNTKRVSDAPLLGDSMP